MKRIIAVAIVAGILTGGCATSAEQKKGAYKRWHKARSHVVYEVGEECFRSGDLDKAYSNASEAAKLDGEFLPARLLLAKVLVEQGQYAQAVEELKAAEAMAPKSEQVAYLMAVALEKRREFLEAIKYYQRARALNPNNDAYVTATAEVLVSMNKPHHALELLEAHLERHDGQKEMFGLCGELALLVGDGDQAVEYFKKCLDADPADMGVQEGLAKAMFLSGRHSEALTLLRKLEAHSAYRNRAAWVYLMIGDCLLALDRPAEARSAYQSATAAAPTDAKGWICLTKAAVVLGNAQEAIVAARQVISLGGEGLEVTTLLSYALILQARHLEASRVLQAATGKYPQDATLQCMLGQCHQALGEPSKAQACYVQALRVDPGHVLAKALLTDTSAGSIR